MNDWSTLESSILSCRLCPRLVAWREEVARVKRRAYRDEDYWGKPVPGFGDPAARVLIVGLAPGAHGANRTGRMFTGDSSGDFLYAALHRAGFASQPTSRGRDDGLTLTDAYISAACRCAPPDNKPAPDELAACRPFLARRSPCCATFRWWSPWAGSRSTRCCESTLISRSRFSRNRSLRTTPRASLGDGLPMLVTSYHPSRQNTQTGRLTTEMFNDVWTNVRETPGIEGSPATRHHVSRHASRLTKGSSHAPTPRHPIRHPRRRTRRLAAVRLQGAESHRAARGRHPGRPFHQPALGVLHPGRGRAALDRARHRSGRTARSGARHRHLRLLAIVARRAGRAPGGRGPRGDGGLARLRDPLRQPGGRGHGRAGAQPGRRSGHLRRSRPGGRGGVDGRTTRQPSPRLRRAQRDQGRDLCPRARATGRRAARHRVRRAGLHDDAVRRARAGNRPSAHRGGQRACGRPALRPAP